MDSRELVRPANVKGCYFHNITNTLFPFGGLGGQGITQQDGAYSWLCSEIPARSAQGSRGGLEAGTSISCLQGKCPATVAPLWTSFLALILFSSLQRIVLQFNINKNVNNKYPPHYQIVNFVSPRSTPACSARFLKVPGCSIVSQYPEQKMGICSLSCNQGLH